MLTPKATKKDCRHVRISQWEDHQEFTERFLTGFENLEKRDTYLDMGVTCHSPTIQDQISVLLQPGQERIDKFTSTAPRIICQSHLSQLCIEA